MHSPNDDADVEGREAEAAELALIERVQLHEDGLDIIWRDDSWQRFCRELARSEFVAEQRTPIDAETVE